MQQLVLNTEDGTVKYAFELFIENYRDSIIQFINNVLRNETGSSDADIVKGEDGTITIYKSTPDKGWVLTEALEDGVPLIPAQYVTLADGNKYVTFSGDKISLFVKQDGDTPDLKIGSFPNLNEAFKQIGSDEVNSAIAIAIEKRDAAKKVEEEVERKAKLKALANNETTAAE